MKKLCRILSFLLFFILSAGLIAAPAHAADLEYTATGTVGNVEYFVFYSDPYDEILEAKVYNGVVPGMNVEVSGGATLGLVGTPTTDGEFTMKLTLKTQKLGEKDVKITVTLKPAKEQSSAGTPTVTKNPTGETVVEGGSAVFIAKASNARQYVWEIAIGEGIVDCEALPGYLGEKVKVSGADTQKLTLSNIPLSLNNAYVRCKFVGAEESVYSEYAKITVTAAKDAAPVVTKHPTDETCEVGGEVVFLSRANYAQSFVWQLVAPDGTTYDCKDAPKTFKGLRVFDADKELIVIENVPMALDGYQVICKFTGNGEVSSKPATIHVTEKATEPPTEAPTEPPTEAPTEPPTEAPTEPPTEAPTEPPTEAPTTAPADVPTEPVTEAPPETKPAAQQQTPTQPIPTTGNTDDGGRTVLLIVLAVVALVAIAIAVFAAITVVKIKENRR